ncbi:MAG TPA: hypothetical protein VIS07_11155 [Candidatus Binatia bacterium]
MSGAHEAPGRPAARASERLVWALLLAASAAFVGAIVFAVPPNMDEYVHYHPIACAAFPLAALHDLRAGCDGRLDLALFGHFLPLRAYRYAGASTALWYWPLYELFPSRHGPRLLGVVSLFLTSLGIARLARVPWRVAWLAGAFCVPLAFTMIVDTGPVGYQVVATVWGVVLVRFLVSQEEGVARARVLAASVLLGLGLFLAVEKKPFFVYQLPGLALLGLVLGRLDARAADGRPGLVVAAARLVPAGLVLAILVAILVHAETRRGYPYLYDLTRVGSSIPLTDLAAQLEHLRTSHLLEYLTDFRTFGHRVFGFHPGAPEPATVVWWLLVVLAAALGLRASSERRGLALRLVACVLAALVTLVLVNLNRLTWGGHHVIGAWPFLVAGLAFALQAVWRAGRRGTVAVLLLALAATQAWVLRDTLARRPDPVSSWDLVAIHDHLDASGLAEDHVVVALDWGSYYVKSLYGPREQLVTWVEPLREREEARRLRALARRTGRKLAVIRRRDTSADLALLESELPPLERHDVPGTAPDADWQLWLER